MHNVEKSGGDQRVFEVSGVPAQTEGIVLGHSDSWL